MKKKDKSKGVSDACVAKSDNDDSDFALVGLPSIFYFYEWILDSRWSYHMCLHKEWFSSFKELDGGVVHMGNNGSCNTIGISSICLKNHDGSTKVLTELVCTKFE